jgi:IclR family KDG regulon transcriptional repressor
MEMILRAVAIYLILLVVFKVVGRRALLQMTSFDLILLLIISEATQQALLGNDFSVTGAMLTIITLVAIDMLFGILQALGEEREIGITELSQRVMMSKSTVYRFLQTMKSLGYVAQEGESEKYSLTLKLFELGARALQNVDLIRSADIQMRELSRLTKETVHLGALDEDSIVYIHKIDSMYNLRMYSRIGRRNPLYSTAIGKVLLAWRDREEVKQILEGVEYKRSTERTITSTEELLSVLDKVREQGYGEDNQEQEEGLRCIGVPVFDRFGVVIAGLSISFPTLRFSEERLHEYVEMLHTAARKISEQMGYNDYPF